MNTNTEKSKRRIQNQDQLVRVNFLSMEWFEREDFWRNFYPYLFPAERFAAAKDEVSRILTLTQCTGGSLLDLCCGPGRHAVEFMLRGFRVTGVDRSPFLLDRACARIRSRRIG